MNYKALITSLLAVLLTLVILFFPYLAFDSRVESEEKLLRVMTYSSFMQKWGAGPEIARLFREQTGWKIRWLNAGNAGLLIERLKFKGGSDRPDVVIGFDQFSIYDARKSFQWLEFEDSLLSGTESLLPEQAQFKDFVAYDWGPMTFVHREGEVTPPSQLEDLLDPSYAKKIILQDPRMSSPGLQFFLWVLREMGEEEGFRFLKKLRPSIKIMTSSWSDSYSLFKIERPSMVFSYFTSPYFHQVEENDKTYRAAFFNNSHPIQVEYAGVPNSCQQCEGGQELVKFLLQPEIQKLLMQKNYMFPVVKKAMQGSVFRLPKGVKYSSPLESFSLIKRKKELIKRWKKVFY